MAQGVMTQFTMSYNHDMMLYKYNYSNSSLAYAKLSSLVLHTNLVTQN
jgi:hypothetical protein